MKSTYKILFAYLAVLAVSCTKTNYEQVQLPYNDIERFSIAGYGDADSIHAVIERDTIFIYWDISAARPLKIKPAIAVSEGATIFPASGAEVGFADTTKYTVTAADGTVKKFAMKPVLRQAIPIITALPARHEWVEQLTLQITGEYFLSGGDTGAVSVYAQRLSDGFEIELPLIRKLATNTSITVSSPTNYSDLDTGWHRIFLKVGDVVSASKDLFINQPYPRNAEARGSLVEKGAVKPGQQLTLNYTVTDTVSGYVTRFYNTGNVKNVTIYLIDENMNYTAILNSTEVTATPGQVKFKLPMEFSQYVGSKIYSIVVNFPYRYDADHLIDDGPWVEVLNGNTYIGE